MINDSCYVVVVDVYGSKDYVFMVSLFCSWGNNVCIHTTHYAPHPRACTPPNTPSAPPVGSKGSNRGTDTGRAFAAAAEGSRWERLEGAGARAG